MNLADMTLIGDEQGTTYCISFFLCIFKRKKEEEEEVSNLSAQLNDKDIGKDMKLSWNMAALVYGYGKFVLDFFTQPLVVKSDGKI